jgi:Mg2+ and Co2+ transporter CorA
MQQDLTTVATKRGAKPAEPTVAQPPEHSHGADLGTADAARGADAAGVDEITALHRRIAQLEAQSAADADMVERAFKERMELLRLRDLVLSTERMLGSARGEIERLNDRLFSYEGLLQRHHDVITSTTWKVAWKVFGPYRNFRSRQESK